MQQFKAPEGHCFCYLQEHCAISSSIAGWVYAFPWNNNACELCELYFTFFLEEAKGLIYFRSLQIWLSQLKTTLSHSLNIKDQHLGQDLSSLTKILS